MNTFDLRILPVISIFIFMRNSELKFITNTK